MIHYFKHNQIDKTKWDAAITASPQCLPYALSWYLDGMCNTWDALILDDYQAVMPLPYNKKWGFNYIYPPYFIQQLGVFSKSDLSKKLIQDFCAAIPEKFKFIEYNLNIESSSFGEDILSHQKFKVSKNLTHHLSLKNNYAVIEKKYSVNLKRNLKKAISKNIVVVENSNAENIVELFRNNRGAKISNLNENNYGTFLKTIAAAPNRNIIKVYTANVEQEFCAGAIFLEQNEKLIFIFSATNAYAKEIGAMPFLIDYVIRQFAETNFTLDFEGSNNSPLARFYKSFGSDEKIYFQLQRNQLPKPIRWLKK